MDREALIAAMQAAAADAAKPREITVPKWGVIYVRDVTVAEASLNLAEQEAAEGDDGKTTASQSTLARSACRVICDENGARLFDPGNTEDVALLASQPWSILRKVLAAADSVAGNA
jgi:hypothetical protein